MNIPATQAPTQLKKQALPAITLIYGAEPLLNEEALDAARTRAKQDGFLERSRIDANRATAWNEVITELESPSLFSPTRLIELHSDAKNLDPTASKTLTHISQHTFPNNRLILNLPHLELKGKAPKWLESLRKHPDYLEIASSTLYPRDFAQQIKNRLTAKNIQLDHHAFEQFLTYHEGNLLAAQQSINRLAHYEDNGRPLTIADIHSRLDDLSRLNTFTFTDALFNGNWIECYRILENLEPTLHKNDLIPFIGLIANNLRTLFQISTQNPQNYFAQHKTPPFLQKKYTAALRYHRPANIAAMLKLVAKLDRLSKGVEAGDAWLTLKQYCLLRAYP